MRGCVRVRADRDEQRQLVPRVRPLQRRLHERQGLVGLDRRVQHQHSIREDARALVVRAVGHTLGDQVGERTHHDRAPEAVADHHHHVARLAGRDPVEVEQQARDPAAPELLRDRLAIPEGQLLQQGQLDAGAAPADIDADEAARTQRRPREGAAEHPRHRLQRILEAEHVRIVLAGVVLPSVHEHDQHHAVRTRLGRDLRQHGLDPCVVEGVATLAELGEGEIEALELLVGAAATRRRIGVGPARPAILRCRVIGRVRRTRRSEARAQRTEDALADRGPACLVHDCLPDPLPKIRRSKPPERPVRSCRSS